MENLGQSSPSSLLVLRIQTTRRLIASVSALGIGVHTSRSSESESEPAAKISEHRKGGEEVRERLSDERTVELRRRRRSRHRCTNARGLRKSLRFVAAISVTSFFPKSGETACWPHRPVFGRTFEKPSTGDTRTARSLKPAHDDQNAPGSWYAGGLVPTHVSANTPRHLRTARRPPSDGNVAANEADQHATQNDGNGLQCGSGPEPRGSASSPAFLTAQAVLASSLRLDSPHTMP